MYTHDIHIHTGQHLFSLYGKKSLKALNKWQLGWQGVLRCLNQWEPEWPGPALSKPMSLPLPACRLSHRLSWGSIALFTLLRPLCRFWPIVLLHIPHSMHRETLFTYKIYLNMITSPSHIFFPSTWKVKEMIKLHVITGSDDSSARHCNFNVVAGCKELKRMCIQKHFPGGTSGGEPTCQCRRCKRPGFDPWVGKIPWKRKWQPTPVFLPGDLMDRGAWRATVHGITRAGHDWSD